MKTEAEIREALEALSEAWDEIEAAGIEPESTLDKLGSARDALAWILGIESGIPIDKTIDHHRCKKAAKNN